VTAIFAPAQERPERTPYALDRPLPTEVVAGTGVWLGYRRYPVFGWRWLRGRSLIFGGVIAVFAIFIGLGLGITTGSARGGLMAALYFAAGFMVMCTTGPLLAAMVRHARWPLARERLGIVLAMLLGIVVSYFADEWSSNYLEQNMPKSDDVRMVLKPPTFTPLETAALKALNLTILVLIYGALGGGLALRAYLRELGRWQTLRQTEAMAALQSQKQQVDLRLGVLQAQVEPHFLFNTLASVRALVRQQPERAEATLDALVEYLRASIPRMRDETASLHSTLGQQLDMCASYLELMRLRTDDRLRYDIAAEPALRERPFPPMLLITLVENAIKHGIEPKPGAGRVEIVADIVDERSENTLRVRVIDDGLGLQPGVGGGMGLANVRAQLETRFAGRARLELRSAPGGGTVAELSVPFDEERAIAGVRMDAAIDTRSDGEKAPE
jgi:two-component sensor histidine kinase